MEEHNEHDGKMNFHKKTFTPWGNEKVTNNFFLIERENFVTFS